MSLTLNADGVAINAAVEPWIRKQWSAVIRAQRGGQYVLAAPIKLSSLKQLPLPCCRHLSKEALVLEDGTTAVANLATDKSSDFRNTRSTQSHVC
jgi:hypothetical protein